MTISDAKKIIKNSDSNDEKSNALSYLIQNDVLDNEIISLAVYCLTLKDDRLKDLSFRFLCNIQNDFVKEATERVAELIMSKDIEIRNLAGDILVTIGYQSGFAIVKYLYDEDDQIRQYAAEMSGRFKNKEISHELYRLVNDEDINTCSSTIESLGSLKDPDAVPILIEKYFNEEDLRPIIVESLGKIGSDEAVEFLYTQMGVEEDIFVKYSIIDALSLSANSIEVINALKDQFEYLDLEAQIIALKAIYVISSRAELEFVIDDDYRFVAHKAITDQDPDIRAAGLLSMGNEFQIDDIPFLVILVIYKDIQVQEHVVSVLLYNCEDLLFIEFIKKLLYNKLVSFNSIEFFTLISEILLNEHNTPDDFVLNEMLGYIFNEFDINKEKLVMTLYENNPDLITEIINKLLTENKIDKESVDEFFSK